MLTTPENHLQRRNGTQNSSRELVAHVGKMGTNQVTVIAEMVARKKMATSPRTTLPEEIKNVIVATKLDT
jgi:hypothetical protein